MPHLLSIFGIAGLLSALPNFAEAQELKSVRYSGELTHSDKAGEGLILRKFEVLLLLGTDDAFFSVMDDDRDGSPWPESYGQLNTSKGPKPHLVYKYDGSAYTLPLPPLRLKLPDDVQPGSSWTVDGWTFEVADSDKSAARPAWNINARERRGRRQKLKLDADSGLLSSASQDVFMGQGEQFELNLKQVAGDVVIDSKVDQTNQLLSDLLVLQSTLARRPDTQLAELSPRQIDIAKSRVDTLSTLAKGTPLQETVLRISRDVTRQGRRVEESMKRQQQLVGKAAPDFVLNLVASGTLESESLRGKTVILHFWKYADKPLSEPYGQVGYLEFLFNKRKQANVGVVGIAMNPSLQQKDRFRSAIRSARKLTEFMNLTYPIGYDDGSLLRTFGDPRDSGGELPLWVVLSPTGKVTHYHSGFYEVDQRHGLKQLDDVISKQLPDSK